jgi:DNA-binding response OmpR family regulator
MTEIPFPTRPEMVPLDQTIVLVVDDDPSVRRLLSLAFTLEGFAVRSAADGEEALECARRERPAAVVLDAVMPGLGGIETCRLLRGEPDWEPVIVMLTGRTELVDRRAALESGADDYVVKPVRVVDVVARVKARLQKATAPGTSRFLGSQRICQELKARSAEPMAIAFVEVRGLKQFVRRYSFARGDRLLDFVGDLLLKLAGDRPGDLAARLGADQFLVVTTPEAVEGLTDRLVAAYAAQRPRFYDEADARRGWFEVTDRRGRMSRHRLLPLAVGVALNHPGPEQHHLELLERASEMARYARGHGPVAVDRRLVSRSPSPQPARQT